MILKLKITSFLGFFITIATVAQATFNGNPESYIAYHTSETINIDGNEDDISWKKVAWSKPFSDIEGIKTPKYKTEVKMLWDETYFYILAILEEPHVWANITKHDAIIFYNNNFEVFVDPNGDTHNYYEIEVNALNTIWDLFLTKPYRENTNVVLNDWTATGMKSAISINGTLNNSKDTDKSWIVEMAIPWDVFKTSYFKKNIPKDTFWRVNFSRVNWAFQLTDGKYERKKDANGKLLPEYNWVWSPQGVINMHEPEKWGYVYFSSKKAGVKDNFTIANDEKIKWELYKIYRAQKQYFKANKSWATSIKKIATSVIVIDDKTIQPVLENYTFGFIISVKSPFSDKLLVIKEDGKFISI